MEPREARDAARRKLGNTTRIREEIYAMNSIRPIETLRLDVREQDFYCPVFSAPATV